MSLPELTPENYYDHDVRSQYMTVHTFLDYAGYLGVLGCEARAEAMRKGEWSEPTTKAMLIGSYVDASIEGEEAIEKFREEHPEIFLKDGVTLKADFKQAELMLERMREDAYFMSTLSGEKQKIFTADLFGTTWCCKLDSYIPDTAIVDLKTTSDLHRMWKVQDYGYVSVAEYWGYTIQLAVYQRIVEINTGKKLPCYLSFVTKEEYPELCVVNIDQVTLDHALNTVEMNMPTIIAIRNGEQKPCRCEKCNYCKSTKKLTHAISMFDLIEDF